jgi:hypothetical protein
MVNTKQKDEIEFAAFMGIDWADQTHAWALELPRIAVSSMAISPTRRKRSKPGRLNWRIDSVVSLLL